MTKQNRDWSAYEVNVGDLDREVQILIKRMKIEVEQEEDPRQHVMKQMSLDFYVAMMKHVVTAATGGNAAHDLQVWSESVAFAFGSALLSTITTVGRNQAPAERLFTATIMGDLTAFIVERAGLQPHEGVYTPPGMRRKQQ